MGKHARIESGGHVSIDTTAWLEQRTGGPDPDLSQDLHTWAVTHTDTGQPGPARPDALAVPRNWPAVTRAWCTDRGHETPEPDFLAHTSTRLDTDLGILRATVGRQYRIAVVGLGWDVPVVHAETPHLDPWEWFDADSVDICCPNGHGWTWRTGRELVTADGSFTTLTVVFGPDLDAPFTPCPHCSAYQKGLRRLPCGCDGPWIICPVCGSRCDVELPTR